MRRRNASWSFDQCALLVSSPGSLFEEPTAFGVHLLLAGIGSDLVAELSALLDLDRRSLHIVWLSSSGLDQSAFVRRGSRDLPLA